jgi:hypothetical protein
MNKSDSSTATFEPGRTAVLFPGLACPSRRQIAAPGFHPAFRPAPPVNWPRMSQDHFETWAAGLLLASAVIAIGCGLALIVKFPLPQL